MAIDTRNERSSACWPMLPWRGLLPLPDGTVSQFDRAHSAFAFAMEMFTGSPTVPGHELAVGSKRTHFQLSGIRTHFKVEE